MPTIDERESWSKVLILEGCTENSVKFNILIVICKPFTYDLNTFNFFLMEWKDINIIPIEMVKRGAEFVSIWLQQLY